ncbi:MAG: SH3 domain-containing protein [Planctomycetota bacterium]
MTSQRIWTVFVLAVVSLVAPAGVSTAQLSTQVEKLESYKAVVAGDRAIVRCGPGAAYYPISGELKQGVILTVDGQTSSGWLRVGYPETSTALVRADHVDVQTDTQTAVLNRDSSLAAFNASTGARGSWSKLLAEPLPAGTRLRVIAEAVNELTGELAGYEVEAPDAARGFIRADVLRRATSADLEAAEGLSTGGTETGRRTETIEAEEVASPAQETSADTWPDGEPTTPVADIDEPAATVAEVDTGRTEPVDDQPASGQGTETTTPAETPADTPANTPAPRVIQSLDDLNEAFDEVQAQDIAEAEFDQLLSEVGRMIEATPADDTNRGLIAALESRQTVLRLRQRIQQVYRENQVAANAADAIAMQTEREVQRIKQDLGFTAVGRLLPSAVYDGDRLPRMFRIQALDTTEAPRTLGYLRPDPAFSYETKLNQTVGVVGAIRNDARMNLQVIEPIRVELVDVGG